MFISKQPNIIIIRAVVFMCISKLLGSSKFQLYLCSSNIQANFIQLVKAPDLSNISSKYYKFANVFSKTKTKVLAPGYSYNL